ncbi:hypothetical protein [Bosea sp. F3-2]|uniref:hypothetical protein n=1 Tax=Bosea sp. F3-2 TaxID=2599640 RepID=UPI0020C0ACC6|nr:hypothetical protein [Bosea sp. F3-2]
MVGFDLIRAKLAQRFASDLAGGSFVAVHHAEPDAQAPVFEIRGSMLVENERHGGFPREFEGEESLNGARWWQNADAERS